MSESGEYHCMMPAPAAVPIADENGNVTVGWRAFFRVMQARTGGVPGIATGDVVGTVTDEAAAREAADAALQTAVNAEATARAAGDAAEALARANGDAALNAAKAVHRGRRRLRPPDGARPGDRRGRGDSRRRGSDVDGGDRRARLGAARGLALQPRGRDSGRTALRERGRRRLDWRGGGVTASPPSFVVLAMPRSRTKWLSQFLSYGPWQVGHDEIRHCRSMDDVAAWLSQPFTGTIETAARAAFWRLLPARRSRRHAAPPGGRRGGLAAAGRAWRSRTRR